MTGKDQTAPVAGPGAPGDLTAVTEPAASRTVVTQLTVLVVGTDDWAAEQAATALETAGHKVLTCHEAGESVFPCNALIPGRACPLDMGCDAVLTARARPSSVPTPGEVGVVCALHAGIPLVTAGVSGNNPFHSLAAGAVGADGDVVEACEKAAALFDLRERKP